jgi:hypothetical protein
MVSPAFATRDVSDGCTWSPRDTNAAVPGAPTLSIDGVPA